jgi:hypothetical protein
MTISRTELKYQLGLGKVSDITSVRKALGQREWQNSQVNEIDATEVREYYRLVREEMLAPADALIQIAVDRNGYSSQCDEIDSEAIDHSQHRDGEEEKSEIVMAVRGVVQESSLAMADVAEAAADQVVDAFVISLVSNVSDRLNQKAGRIRGNFGQITSQIRSMPLDLRNAALPKKKQAQKQISGLWD